MTEATNRAPARVTKAELLRLLEPYGPDKQVVFVSFEPLVVHEEIEVAKSHCTTRLEPDGTRSMPVAIYLVDEGKVGTPGVLGVDPKDILPGGWPKQDD